MEIGAIIHNKLSLQVQLWKLNKSAAKAGSIKSKVLATESATDHVVYQERNPSLSTIDIICSISIKPLFVPCVLMNSLRFPFVITGGRLPGDYSYFRFHQYLVPIKITASTIQTS